jgi:uncharacterized protein (TIGR02145 family)
LYSETHQLTSNSNGLITTSIGGGTPVVGSMDSIDWSLGDVYIKTEVDVNGGSNYEMLSSNQLLSVPYALFAQNSGSGTPGPAGPQGPQGSLPPGTQSGEINYWNGSSWVTLPPGGRGQSLIMCDSVPTWGGCLPEVTTSVVTSIFADSAICGGNVASDGGSMVTNRGVVYGTSSNPTTSGTITIDGSGMGSFVSTLTGLTASTTYYARAYATNGVGTAYGNEVSFSTNTSNGFSSCGGVTDVDENSYQTVQIGSQCWMQSNLKVSKYRNGDIITNITDSTQWTQTNTNGTGAWCNYINNTNNGTTYGKLYNWYAVNDSRGLCPTGWHVPTDSDWNVMVIYLDPNADTACSSFCVQSSTLGGSMKSTSVWNSPNAGATNSSGFTGLPGGYRPDNGDFNLLGNYGYWWSSTNAGSGNAWYRFLPYYESGIYTYYYNHRNGFSVRCVKDNSSIGSATIPTTITLNATGITSNSATLGGVVTSDGGATVTSRGVAYGFSSNPTTSGNRTSDGSGVGTYVSTLSGLTASTTYYARAYSRNIAGTAYGNEISFTTITSNGFSSCGGITDLDGYTYQTVQIGTQCWTQSNLKVSKYSNGDSIINITDNTQWSQTYIGNTGAWCNYNNDVSNGTTFGKLYNWNPVNDTRGLCPTGWHVPTDSEWNVMVKFLDPNADTACINCLQSSTVGSALKSTTSWNSPICGNSSNTGATNLSGFTGLPGGIRQHSFFDIINLGGVWWSSSIALVGARARGIDCYSSDVNNFTSDHRYGLSVRCVRD